MELPINFWATVFDGMPIAATQIKSSEWYFYTKPIYAGSLRRDYAE